MVANAGDTFIFTFDGSHLWIALTSPLGPNGEFLAVNLTSVKNDSPLDDTCIISAGEHPWVRKKTEVYYRKAQEWRVAGFDSLKSLGDSVAPQLPVSKALLLRIQEGAFQSPHMKERFVERLKKELTR